MLHASPLHHVMMQDGWMIESGGWTSTSVGSSSHTAYFVPASPLSHILKMVGGTRFIIGTYFAYLPLPTYLGRQAPIILSPYMCPRASPLVRMHSPSYTMYVGSQVSLPVAFQHLFFPNPSFESYHQQTTQDHVQTPTGLEPIRTWYQRWPDFTSLMTPYKALV